jgi:hypothetical protein
MTTVDEFLEQVESAREACAHFNFHTSARIGRLTKKEGGPVTGYSADIRIKCSDCGHPFTWIGVPLGSSPSQPMASVDCEELRAPIQPSDFALQRINATNN